MPNGQAVMALAPKTAASLPNGIPEKDTSFDMPYPNVRLNIRATDVDSISRGWAGTIDGIAQTRTRVVSRMKPTWPRWHTSQPSTPMSA